MGLGYKVGKPTCVNIIDHLNCILRKEGLIPDISSGYLLSDMDAYMESALSQVTEKATYQKCKTRSCRDTLPQKSTLPKSNETSYYAHSMPA